MKVWEVATISLVTLVVNVGILAVGIWIVVKIVKAVWAG